MHTCITYLYYLSFLKWYTVEAARIQTDCCGSLKLDLVLTSSTEQFPLSDEWWFGVRSWLPYIWKLKKGAIIIYLYSCRMLAHNQCLTKENLIWCNPMWSENHYSEFQRKTYSCQKCVLCNQIWCSAWSVQIQIGTTQLKKSKVNKHSCLVLSPWSLS